MKTQVRTFIYGGRLVEDLFATFEPGRFTLLAAVQGQSLISSYAAAQEAPSRLSSKNSEGPTHSVAEDFRSSLLPKIAGCAGDLDLLLWDLTDETFGVLITPGAVTTRTTTTVELPELEPADSRFVTFGSEEHFALWKAAAERFVADLESLGIKQKVLVVCPPWADRDTSGRTIPSSMGRAVDSINQGLSRYRSLVLQLGLNVLDAPESIVRSAGHPDHVDSPYAYAQPTLEHLRRQVVQILDPPPSRGKHGWDSLVDPWVDSLPVKAEKIPSAYRIWQSARRYYLAGELDRAELCVQLNKILHNSVVPAELQLGKDVLFGYGGMGVVIHKDAQVDEGVTIAPQVTLGGNGSPVRVDPVTKARSTVPRIDAYAVLSGGARILGGVRIGAFAIVAPNSVVGTDVPPGGIFGGAPARQIGQVTGENALRYKAKYLPLRGVTDESFVELFTTHYGAS